MNDPSLITHDEHERAPMVSLPSWPSDCEPDSGTMRAISQIFNMAFGAHRITITADFGDAGAVNWTTIHPDLIEMARGEMADDDAEYDEDSETPAAA